MNLANLNKDWALKKKKLKYKNYNKIALKKKNSSA